MTGQRSMIWVGGGLLLVLIYTAASVLVWDLGRGGAPDIPPFLYMEHFLGTDREGRDWVRVLAGAGFADAATVLMSTTVGMLVAFFLGCLGGAGLPGSRAFLRSFSAVSVLLVVLASLAIIDSHEARPSDPREVALLMIVLFGAAAAAEPAERFRQVLKAEQKTPHYRAAVELGVLPMQRFMRHALPAIWAEFRAAFYRMSIGLTAVVLTLNFLIPGGGAASLGDLIAREVGRFDPDQWWHLANPVAVVILVLLSLCLLSEGRRR